MDLDGCSCTPEQKSGKRMLWVIDRTPIVVNLLKCLQFAVLYQLTCLVCRNCGQKEDLRWSLRAWHRVLAKF